MLIVCACAGISALAFVRDASAVFTDIGALTQIRHQIRLRVGTNSTGSIDTLNFGTISGDKVGDNTTHPTASTDLEVQAWTTIFTPRTVTLTADSSSGLQCTTAATCGSTIIPFSQVSWTSGNATTPSGGVFDMQSGAFNGSAAQVLAQFPSMRRMQNNLTFQYNNSAVYPAGTYSGVVTFTASMP